MYTKMKHRISGKIIRRCKQSLIQEISSIFAKILRYFDIFMHNKIKVEHGGKFEPKVVNCYQ